MAVLSKIRQRSLLLIGVIGFCLLAFLIGDIFSSGNINLASKDVGSVNGKDITFDEFRVKVNNVEKSGQGMTASQAASRVWDQEVAIALLTAEFDKLGIRVSEKHILDAFKNDQQIGQNPMFKNEKGEFDVAKLQEFIKTNPEAKKAIEDREKDAVLNAKYLIYNTLVKGGVFVTEAEGKYKYEAETTKATFDYVGVLFSTIKDSDVKVSDSELTDYMKKHEKRYKADENRELEYVLVEDKPSAQDEAEVKQAIDKLLTAADSTGNFRTTNNIAEFVNQNSDIPFDTTYIAKKDLPTEHAEALFNLPTGTVYGPYMQGKYYAITRSLGRKSGANAKASHVLISWEGTQVNKREKRTKEEAKAKAEALLAQAKANPAGFAMLAITNSDDSSAQQGGDLGYFAPGQMVKPFNDFVFNNPIGTIGLVETQFGYHVINVTDKQDAVKLATIAQKIEPSDATTDALYQKAVKVEMEATDKDFASVAKAEKLELVPSVKVKAMDEYFGSVGAQRQIVQWAFNSDTEVGDVKRFEVVNVGNVIVKLKKVNPEGLLSLDEARTAVEPILKNKKKAELIRKKMTGSSLAAIAQASGSTVQSATDLTLENSMIPNAGPEPKVVGTAIATGVGKISKPIDGNSGVYVVAPKAVAKAPAVKDHVDFVNKLKGQAAGYSSRVIPALKSDAKIVDNRAKFNY
ncbi:peptidylprolyl isomerase [Flavobacterium selenitireducens]|uniref:peptidylprolyl isomerase n=1 Tax=Flavobacterium selenitireducens TaxID=2722704 RepID=UPI00168B1057|nr:peptidylprolyl isomerase [Flavobacterium selenitireducens]MBD3583133.1 peptidylprolyl isomerase [Flavobacterium selenitireducens]